MTLMIGIIVFAVFVGKEKTIFLILMIGK